MWPAPHVNSIDGVLQHFSVAAPLWGSFCQAVGDPGQDVRLVANIPPTVVGDALQATRSLTGWRITAIEAIQLGLVFRACHRLNHMAMGLPLEVWKDPDPWAESTTSPSTSGGTTSLTSTTTTERKMKFASVLEQGDESEFVIEAEANKASYYARYVEKVGGLPADSEDPSIEQISAVMKKVNGLRQPPYCDFSVFVPFAKRHLRAQKYQSFLLQEDGSFLSKMVPGPENFGHWQASFRVMRTTFIMTGVISLSNLMQWEAHIEKLNRQFPNCWGLIAAADYRGRGEFMNKTLAKMRMEIDLGGQPPPGWNLDKPWDMVWARVLKDRDFWNEQVYLPAVSWTARGSRGRPLTPMEEEAKVGLRGGHQALQPEQEEVQDGVDNPRKRSNRVRREARKKRMRAEREELENFRANRRPNGKGGDGKGSKGKNGNQEEECYAWNNGNGLCGGLPPGEKCKGKIPRLHRCTICKSVGHPSRECPQKPNKT